MVRNVGQIICRDLVRYYVLGLSKLEMVNHDIFLVCRTRHIGIGSSVTNEIDIRTPQLGLLMLSAERSAPEPFGTAR
jgi:hypothetical protein